MPASETYIEKDTGEIEMGQFPDDFLISLTPLRHCNSITVDLLNRVGYSLPIFLRLCSVGLLDSFRPRRFRSREARCLHRPQLCLLRCPLPPPVVLRTIAALSAPPSSRGQPGPWDLTSTSVLRNFSRATLCCSATICDSLPPSFSGRHWCCQILGRTTHPPRPSNAHCARSVRQSP